ncbi:efflux RND transporter permease subunit [Neoroseomonas lacus]|uniref:Acriflavine resistance protein B n=1 Tax=Neoroseomonas lacus TaxID=287609 RepID=A0A917K889_9PROT|nr:efflux RND transporter permease subunit [Neoroseomonas lacus]GGJ04692.1 acriflavine resistance protein B [Neoroseomonas lacus]
MNISAPFIVRPVATILLMVALLMAGLISYRLLPVAPLPQIDFPTITVTTQLPGASPEIMASSVTAPLERQFGQIPGVSSMTSSSVLGTSIITVQFDLSRAIDGAALDVQAAINQAAGQLPSNLPAPPQYRKVNPADAPILVLAVQSDLLPLIQVDDYAETVLAEHIGQIEGVAQVGVNGQQKPAVRIQIDTAKLASLGLSLEDVRTAIGALTTIAPQGSLERNTRSFTIYDNGQLLNAEPWNDAIIAYRNGAPVRVRDVGQAVDAAENERLAAYANGRPAILLAISRVPGANVIDTVERIRAALPRLQTAIPPTVTISVLSDRTQTIRAAVVDVQRTLLLTIGLVVVVIFFFLGSARMTLIPTLSVPLALVATFGVLYVLGYSLDNLSLMALTIAVGFVVDDAIVMLENIERHRQAGLASREAALRGSAEIGFTIVSISLSLVAVFIPLFLMPGVVGRLFREFAVTVAATIVISVIVSLTLTPMMAARLLPPRGAASGPGAFQRMSERGFNTLQAGYERLLDTALRHHALTLMVFLASIIATGVAFMNIPKGFFPQQDTGLILGTIQSAPETSFREMTRLSLRLSSLVQQDPDVATVGLSLGSAAGLTENQGRLFISLKPRDDRAASADEIIRRLAPQLAGVPGVRSYLQSVQDLNVGGRLASTQYQYTLQDADAEALDTWAPRIATALGALPQLRDLASDQQSGGTTLTIEIDRDAAGRYGITPQKINNTLYDAFGQRQATQYFTQTNAYHVVLEALPTIQASASALQQIFITSPVTGRPVPMSSLARWTTRPTRPIAVNHQALFPSVTLSFNLAPGVALSEAVAAIDRSMNDLRLPGGLRGSFQGNAQAFQSSLSSVPLLILGALCVIYLILGILYESFIHPLTILSTLPSAGLGAILILWATGHEFDLIAMIAVILLIGIVKKNGIMLVDFALSAERNDGKAPAEAIREACLLRFRPILMTTAAALFGAVPLMLATGTGAELRVPLGLAIVGGLAVSQVLTLFTTPVIYLALNRLRRRIPSDAVHGDGIQP